MVLLVAKLETLAQRMLSKPITNRLKSQVAVQGDSATSSSPLPGITTSSSLLLTNTT